MKKQIKILITSIIACVAVVAGVIVVTNIIPRALCQGSALECERTTTEPTVIQKGQTRKDYYTYKGRNGKTAYQLLENEHAWTEVNSSGLLTAINFRKADEKKKEFWAFYVNGKMAQVGPWDYKTKNGDIIEWKIEKY